MVTEQYDAVGILKKLLFGLELKKPLELKGAVYRITGRKFLTLSEGN